MDSTSNPVAPNSSDSASPGPLTKLTESLAAGDLATATAILSETPWTNITNVVRALPEPERVTAIALLEPEAANQVFHELTDEEVARLRIAQPKPGREGPRPV